MAHQILLLVSIDTEQFFLSTEPKNNQFSAIFQTYISIIFHFLYQKVMHGHKINVLCDAYRLLKVCKIC